MTIQVQEGFNLFTERTAIKKPTKEIKYFQFSYLICEYQCFLSVLLCLEYLAINQVFLDTVLTIIT